jgi:hypothetical protein
VQGAPYTGGGWFEAAEKARHVVSHL